jgi:hypothetical protein
MKVFNAAALALMVSLPWQSARAYLVAQQRGADAEQRQIEMAVSRFMIDSLKHVLKDFAVDPRLYVRPIPRIAPGSRLEFLPKIDPASVTSTSHSVEHMEALVQTLGASGVLSDAGLCTPVIANLCRYSSHKGLITFSAAWLRGDSAEIVVSLWQRGTQPDRETKDRIPVPRAFARIFLLVRTDREWVVREYFTMT